MTSIIRFLVGLFFFQCIIFSGFVLYERSNQVAKPRKLIDIDFSLVDGFETRSKTMKTSMKKIDGQWILTNYDNLPADKRILDEFFNDLKNMEVIWPVASSELAADRFKVTESTATNTLLFKHGDHILATLYKGTTAEWRTVHVRLNDEKEIYTIPIELHRFNSTQIDWFDKNILGVVGDIYRISTKNFTVERKENTWNIDNLPIDKKANSPMIDAWVKRFNSQKVFRLVYRPEELNSIIDLPPYDKLKIQTDFAEQIFIIFKKNSEVFIKKENDNRLFKINRTDIEHYIGLSSEMFSIKE